MLKPHVGRQAAVDNDDFEEAQRLQTVVDELTDKLDSLE